MGRVKNIICALVLFALPGSAWAGKNVHQPFFFSLQKALADNPGILAARDQLRVQQEKVGLAEVELLPDFSVNLSSEYTHSVSGSKTTSSNPATFSFSISQPIIDFDKWLTVDNAQLPVKRAEMTLLIAAEKVFMELVTESVKILKAKAVLERSQNNLELTKEHLRATVLRFEAGELTQTDISQAESRVASIQAELITTQNQIKMGLASFEEIAGKPAPKNLTIPPVLPSVIEMLERASTHVVEFRPDVVVALIQLEEAQRNIKQQQTGLLPTMTFTTDASRSWDASQSSASDSVNFAIGISMPIDARGKYSRKGKKAVWERDEKRAKLDLLRQQAVREVKHALLGLKSARARDRALKKVELAAKVALSGVEKEFTVGTRSSPDLLDAQNELFSAQRDMVKSHYDLILEQYKLLKSKGQLTISKPVFDFDSVVEPFSKTTETVADAAKDSGKGPLRFDQELELDLGLSSGSSDDKSGRLNLKPEPTRRAPAKPATPKLNPRNMPPQMAQVQPQVQPIATPTYAMTGIKALPAYRPGFIVRVATFPKPDETVANWLAENLSADHFSVIKTAEVINGSDYINILSGPFLRNEDAETVKQILENSYKAQPLIEMWDPSIIPGLQLMAQKMDSQEMAPPIEGAKSLKSASLPKPQEPTIEKVAGMAAKKSPQQPEPVMVMQASMVTKPQVMPMVKQSVALIKKPQPSSYESRVIVNEMGVPIGVAKIPVYAELK
jgi:outer membrane protein